MIKINIFYLNLDDFFKITQHNTQQQLTWKSMFKHKTFTSWAEQGHTRDFL